MPSTYLLQQMVVDHHREQIGKGIFSHINGTTEELLSLQALEKIEQKDPSHIREYIEEVIYRIPDIDDLRYIVARKLYNTTTGLPRTNDALCIILSTL